MGERPLLVPADFIASTQDYTTYQSRLTWKDRLAPFLNHIFPTHEERITDDFADWFHRDALNVGNLPYGPWEFLIHDHSKFRFYPKDHEHKPPHAGQFVGHGSDMLNALIDYKRPINLTINGYNRKEKIGILNSPRIDLDKNAPKYINIGKLRISTFGTLTIEGLTIGQVHISGGGDSICFVNCTIGKIDVSSNGIGALNLKGCKVCRIKLVGGCVNDITLNRCWVRSLELPQSSEDTPYKRRAHFFDCRFSTNPYDTILESSQGYSSMRGHLEKSGYSLEAHQMRAIEMHTEWHNDRGVSRLLGAAYGAFTGFGARPGRALIWLALFYFLTVLFLSNFDGGALPLNQGNQYVGWREGFLPACSPPLSKTQECIEASINRSWFLPLQTMFNPLGIFNSRPLVVAATSWGQFVLVLHSVLSAIVIFTLGFSLRRRFKIGS